MNKLELDNNPINNQNKENDIVEKENLDESPPPPEKENQTTPEIIKHIVISGGGAAGFGFLGALKETHDLNIWEYSNIKSIYATSVGSIFAFIGALNIDLTIVSHYFITRPWQNLFTINGNFLQYIRNRGILGKNVIEEMLLPFFKLKELSPEITMQEFYEYTGIEIHCFSTNMRDFSLVDFSYKTHPNWKIVDVIYCSSAIPVIFEPFFHGDDIYIDGAFLCNYPIQQCYDQQKPESVNEILGINLLHFIHEKTTINSNLFDYLNNLLTSMIYKIRLKCSVLKPRHEIIIAETTPLSSIMSVMGDIEQRRQLFELGKETVKKMYVFNAVDDGRK
jgi:predicted acylesterase/phospholipase RssA